MYAKNNKRRQNDIEAAQRIGDPARLFDRFYMQEESRSKGGSGLGLTISRHLAQGMGGNLEASYEETQSGKQLVLTLTLRGSMDCV
ncbi:sensor histidine kinase [Parablautia sp. Marseille-Q6255]|uniref:sensor histidine kinase n=1 Tax=Parablautia sp. Marseille-Q6255 TaxID=3039593 RepID=UPI0024BD21F3|nr:sensor histidine kinase [Parablautia sp. Marseille-Q6255]